MAIYVVLKPFLEHRDDNLEARDYSHLLYFSSYSQINETLSTAI